LKKIKYLPGQYLTLIFRINGRRYIRPYSFSSAPGVDASLDVTVKRVPGGVISNHINDRVKVNDIIEVMTPMGDFIFDHEKAEGKHLVLWGAGSGITPLMSIAKYALSNQTNNKITLVYGNRNFESAIFIEQIKLLREKYHETFEVWYFNSQLSVAPDNPYVIQGRIKPQMVLAVIGEMGKLSHSLHYICGPVGLKESVREVLYELNIHHQNIYSEDFELVKDPKEFENIITQNVEIVKNDIKSNVEVVRGKSILEAGLDSLLDLSYSCQTGSCEICKAKLLSGQVKMLSTSKGKELLKDECLLCCSYPLTSNVKVLVED
jgi:ring-1,2-phenylacetyl-CoA epoxidase subunit PaaE